MLDQSATQRKVYDKAQIGELVKQVVDVCDKHKFTYFSRDIMQLYSLMDRLVLARLSRWRVTDIKLMTREFQSQLLRQAIRKVLCRELFINYLNLSNNRQIFRRKNILYIALICKYIRRKYMIF